MALMVKMSRGGGESVDYEQGVLCNGNNEIAVHRGPQTGTMDRKVGRPSKSFVTHVARGRKSKAGERIIDRMMSSAGK